MRDETCIERVGCLEACRRLRCLVAAVAERDRASNSSAFGAVGSHVRHCVDHFDCFLDGLGHGLIDYDRRRRDERTERDAERSLQCVERILDRLTNLEPEALGNAIDVRQTVASGYEPEIAPSSVRRELAFLSGHTIHHLAIMAAIVGGHGVSIPENLTIAFSTEAHRQAVTIE